MRRTAKRSDGRAHNGESEIEFRGAEKEAIERRSAGQCEARTSVCTQRARVIHHVLMKSHGGKGNRENGLHICTACHAWIHAHPRVSYLRGWLTRGAAQGVGAVDSAEAGLPD